MGRYVTFDFGRQLDSGPFKLMKSFRDDDHRGIHKDPAVGYSVFGRRHGELGRPDAVGEIRVDGSGVVMKLYSVVAAAVAQTRDFNFAGVHVVWPPHRRVPAGHRHCQGLEACHQACVSHYACWIVEIGTAPHPATGRVDRLIHHPKSILECLLTKVAIVSNNLNYVNERCTLPPLGPPFIAEQGGVENKAS